METRSKRNRRDEAPGAAQQSTKEPQQGRGGKAPRGADNKGPGHAAAAQKDKQIAGVSTSPPAELPAQAQAGRVTRSGRGASGSQPPQQPVKGRRTRTKAQEAPAAEVQSKAKAEATAEATEQQGVPGSGAAAAEQQKPNPSGRGASAQPDQGRGMANRQGRSTMDEDKELADMFARGGAGSALQGLLRKLGAGFEDVMPMGMSGSRLKAIMTGLRQMDDEVAQLSALSELNELLSISTEDNLATFPIESMVPLLIQLLNAEHNPDIMLMAARALTFLADVLPQSCSAIVRHGAVPAFCARLLTIEYIDLAEQSLQALEKLSHEHSPSLLQNGGLLAVLSYLDFFPTGVQRTATATAANICRSLTQMPSAASSSTAQAAVKEAIPILTGLLHYSDAKVVDNACVSLSYIAEASAGQPALLEALTSGGLVGQALQLIGLSDTGAMTSQLSLSTYYGLLKLLSTAAASSAGVATTLLGAGVLATTRTLLATSPLLMAGPGGAGASSLLRTPDQLYDVMGLLHEVLPPVPDSQSLVVAGAAVELPGQGAAAGGSRSGSAASRGSELQSYLGAHPPLTAQLCGDILPLVLNSYSATVMPEVRARALRVLLQVLTACPAAQLRESLRDLPLASFLASLLAGRDTPTCAAALHCSEVLMAQLPDVFKHVFLKEGVAHAIEQLAAPAAAGASGAGSPAPPPPLAAPPNARRAPSPTAEDGRRVTRSASARGEDKGTAGAASPGAPSAATGAAAATAVAASTRAIPGSPGGLTLRASLAARALRFQKAHYDAGCGAPQTEGLLQVRALLQRLPAAPTSTLTDLLAIMAASSGSTASAGPSPAAGGAPPGGVSVFELLNSGAVKSLYDFLTGADLPAAAAGSADGADERANAVLRRIAALTRAGLTPAAGSPCNPPLVGLVRKLQAALSSSENFPVYHGRAAPPPGSGSFRSGMYGGRGGSMGGSSGALQPGSLSSGLSMLTHPFKLRLCRHSSDNSLRDYSTNIVLIEPLATMAAIEEFLWSRVYRGVGPGSAPPPPQPSQAQAQQPAADQRQAATSAGAAVAGSNAPGAGAAAGSGTAAGTQSHPIPVDDGAGNRRVTRAQAARERAEAEAATRRTGAVPVPTRGNRRSGGGTAGEAGADQRMADPGEELKEAGRLGRRRSGRREVGGGAGSGAGAGDQLGDSSDPDPELEVDDGHDSGDGEGDADMDDAAGGGDAMFDEDDDDFDDDAMDGDDGDVELGTMTVHDLHVDQDPGRGVQAPAGAAGSSQQPAAAGAPAAKPGAAPGGAAATTRPTSAWGNRAAGAAGGAPAGGSAAAAAPDGAAAPGPAGQAQGGAARSAAHEAAPARMVFVLGSGPNGGGGEERLPLSSACTVFQAIQQLQNQQQQAGAEDGDEDGEEEGGGGGQRRGRRLWEEIHTLYYRPATPADAAAVDGATGQTSTARGAADSGSTAGVSGPLGRWANTPLRELLSPRVPSDLSCSATCREVLALMALLEAVNRLGPRACAELDAAGAGGAEEAAAGPLEATRHAARDEFVSAKLSSKLGQQLKDVLAICGGGMPAWCNSLVGPCRFLFPFEIRKRYFYCTAFGLGRALQHMQQLHTAEAGGALAAAADRDGRELRVGRLQRQKVRVSRKRILESAAKVMELYARSRAVLELEYFNEVGTGLGPTLEFYTLLSHELQRKDLGMWRHEEQDDTQKPKQDKQRAGSGGEDGGAKPSAPTPDSPDRMDVDGGPATTAAAQGQGGSTPPRVQSGSVLVSVPSRRGEAANHDECEYVNAPWGLFPRPLPPASVSGSGGAGAAAAKVVEHFRLLGRTLAKALQDNRLLDLPLSHVFFAAALGSPLDMWDIARFDPGLGATLARLHAALVAHRAAGGAVSGPLLVDGVPLEDLCITFVLPGQPDYPLRPGGGDMVVSTAEQLAEYMAAVTDATLGSGVAAQMGAFREGFNEVFSLSTLSIFNEDEIEVLLCGSGERWTLQALSEAIKFDHGYTANSQPVKYLLEIMSELDAADQRAFLRFVTGCPRLPPGGLTALQPRLTVVRKHPSGGDGPSNGPTPVGSFQEAGLGGAGTMCAADADLPSVMTCANYIKLPPYSSKAVMAARLMYAIREGQGSFDLS